MPFVRYIIEDPQKTKRKSSAGNTHLSFSPENLRLFRYKYCVSQKTLAQILGTYQSAVGLWELRRSHPNESQIQAIERLLNLDEAEIHKILSKKSPKSLDDINRFGFSNEEMNRFCKRNSISIEGLAYLLGASISVVKVWSTGSGNPSAEHYKALSHLMGLSKKEIQSRVSFIVPAKYQIRKKDKRFPKYVVSVRRKYKISQRELALLLDVTTPAIAFWEGGKCYPKDAHIAAIKNLAGLDKQKVKALLAEKEMAKKMAAQSKTIAIPAPAVATDKVISVKP